MEPKSGKSAHRKERLSSRTTACGCQSAVSPPSTSRMPPTPRSIAAGKIAGLEAWHDGARNNDRGDRIGQRAFEAIADFDAYLVLVRRDQKQHAVVLLRLAELPGPEQLIGVGFDIAALQRRHRRHHELDAGFFLEILQFVGKVAADVGVEDSGLVDHTAGQRRKVERGSRRRAQAQHQQGCGHCLQDPHHQPPEAPPPPDEPPPPPNPPPKPPPPNPPPPKPPPPQLEPP